MGRPLRSLALANLTIVLLLLIWPEGFQFLFLVYLLINTVALLVIAGQVSTQATEIERLKKQMQLKE